MKDILLITSSNSTYHEKLAACGYNITEYNNPLSEESIAEISGRTFNGIAVIDIIDGDSSKLERITGILKDRARIIILGNISEGLRSLLIRCGIPDMIEPLNPDLLINYINSAEMAGSINLGNIFILDDRTSSLRILDSVISRFRHNPVIIKSINELFEKSSMDNIQFILINLGTKGFDINEFSRRSYSSTAVKKIPVIPYKDMTEGVYIHEAISGIHRIANIILSFEELYGFLVNILFKKELSSIIKNLNTTIDVENLMQFSKEPLSRIYHTIGSDIFTLYNILKKDNLEKLNSQIDSVRQSIIRVDGLKWLVKQD